MLTRCIEEIFHFIDEDESGLIDFQEMRGGLKRLDTDPAIDLTAEDFEAQVASRGLAMTDGNLDLQCFKTLMNVQLKEYVHKQMAKAAGLVSPDEKLTAILRSLQQTAFVTFSSQEMVQSLESKVATMKLNIHKMQTNIRRMKHDRPPVLRNSNTSSADGLCPYSAALTDTPYHELVDRGGWAPMPSQSQEMAMGLSGVVVSEQWLSADATQTYSSAPVPAVSAASSSMLGQEGTLSPMFSPMMSPMMSALHTHPGHHGFHNEAPGSAVATTPQSLLSSSTPGASNLGMSKKREVETTVVSPVDVLDIRGLNARVDAMQSRLVYTIQQAKAAREKSRAVFARRRDPVSYADSDLSSRSVQLTPASLLDSSILSPGADTFNNSVNFTPQQPNLDPK
mmetsp:Transcript_21680/g.34701  ORF Transcript_21680/g.34701 Transcript_21680/m.34701 type:complete len:395 (-) Transcript_21680:24-1208(-)